MRSVPEEIGQEIADFLTLRSATESAPGKAALDHVVRCWEIADEGYRLAVKTKPYDVDWEEGYRTGTLTVLFALVQAYRDTPGFNEDWRVVE